MQKKLTYIISDIDRALAFEWIATYTDRQRVALSFILLNPSGSALEDFLLERHIPVKRVICRGKKDWPRAWWEVYSHLKKTKPHAVHCHLQQACILGLPAAKMAGIKARIHTRHHSSLHHVYFPKGVYWDKWFNRLSTHIVAISNAVKKILIEWEAVPANKITLIPHGFLLDSFKHPDHNTVETLRTKYDLHTSGPTIGVISRFTEWKGVQYIIPAFKQLLKDHSNAVLLLFNATGDYEEEIKTLLAELPRKSYRTISFEPLIASAYPLFDIFVHTPVDDHSEAFGQVYIEAMAAGVPVVATASGIGNDILQDHHNAVVAGYRSSESIYHGMKDVLDNKELREKIVTNARETAEDFSLDKMIEALTSMYESV